MALDSFASSVVFAAAIALVVSTLIWWCRKIKISKPTTLRVTDISYDSITLEWIKPKQGGMYVKSYTVLYRPNCYPQQNQWMCKETRGNETVINIDDLEPKTRYSFKIVPRCGNVCGETSKVWTSETSPKTPGKPKGKPSATIVNQNSITLRWNEPEYGGDLVTRYIVFYSCTQEGMEKWKDLTVYGNFRVANISGLIPETEYKFKVRPDGEFGMGLESDESDPIMTDKLLSKRLKEQSKLLNEQANGEGDDDFDKIYALPTKHVGGRKYTLGEPSPMGRATNHKVIILIGATGAGKTKLLNSIANYILGVRLDDDFRFKVVVAEGSKSQAHSQTDNVTAYTFHQMDGLCSPYSLTIIDTPGFGDTRGILKDKTIVGQLREFFSAEGDIGIDHIDGVGIVIQSAAVRLTATQNYIYDSILSVFGVNISSCMFLLITFADASRHPTVISSVQQANIPFKDFFTFNNCAMFSKIKPSNQLFMKSFWDLGESSLKRFFDEFGRTDPVSKEQTVRVLTERMRLDALMGELQSNIATGLDKINELQQEEEILKAQEGEVNQTKNNTYKVRVSKRVKKKLPQKDIKALICRNCFSTCHYPCEREDDKAQNCIVMENDHNSSTHCTVCPKRCSSEDHSIENSRYESFEQTETRTIESLKARYDEAMTKAQKTKNTIDKLKNELSEMQQDVMSTIKQARECKAQLDKIAMKPGILTEIGYIDLLIKSEKEDMKPGFSDRINTLEKLKQAAGLLTHLNEEGNLPPVEFMNDWWTRFRQNQILN